MAELPETVLQFGSGKFLRGFADLFIHQANEEGQNVGRIVVVQSTGDTRAQSLARQGGRYHVVVRGLEGGKVIDRVEESASISRALVASSDWDAVLAVARTAELRYLLSNTAEVGYNCNLDDVRMSPPSSFPAKLLMVLWERFGAGLPAVTVFPCELFEHNADILRGLVLQLARDALKAPAGFLAWVEGACAWRSALVDRIVATGPLGHDELKSDSMAVVAEPYSLWAIEVKDKRGSLFRHPAIKVTDDVMPFFLRKVRILNAAHTALVGKAMPKGYTTVLQAMEDADIAAWLERLLFEEVLPVLQGRVEEPEAFARQTLERFRNPFLEHKLSDIRAYHEQKVKIRLLSTRAEYFEKFGRPPPLLDEAIAAG
jgi:tagaturonate reductase